jgi:hypothetical protein
MKPDDKETYSEEEIAARMDGAVRRALKTPPTPTKDFGRQPSCR